MHMIVKKEPQPDGSARFVATLHSAVEVNRELLADPAFPLDTHLRKALVDSMRVALDETDGLEVEAKP